MVWNTACIAWATRGVCSIHAVMLEAQKHMEESLSRHTLADLSARTVAKAPENFGPQVIAWLEDRTTHRRSES